MANLSGNKGEWSEVYAFLNVLGKGRIYGADSDVRKLDDMVFDVVGVIRNEDDTETEFRRSPDGSKIEIYQNDRRVKSIDVESILEESEVVLDSIVESKGSFCIESVSRFMESIGCHRLKAPSRDKTDITLLVNDPRSGRANAKLGFSIKSMLGSPSTLLNAARTTNFRYRLNGAVTQNVVTRVNERSPKDKLSDVYGVFREEGVALEFDGVECSVLRDNLTLIDSRLPEMVSEILKIYYLEGINRFTDIVKILNKNNPMGYNTDFPNYEYKIKKMLTAFALGVNPSKPWDGHEDANGGYLIVRGDGEIFCFNVYNRNEFEDYLLKNTRLETASTTRHEFSRIWRSADGSYYMNLNLQIRFL